MLRFCKKEAVVTRQPQLKIINYLTSQKILFVRTSFDLTAS